MGGLLRVVWKDVWGLGMGGNLGKDAGGLSGMA